MATLIQPTGKLLTTNGLSIHYLDWGDADAPPVVCVHGYTSSAQAFNAPARHFQDRFHLIAPDVRGHGESAWSPAGEYQYADQASDLAALVDQLGLARFTLIGTSMGGIIAMAYAGAHGERLRGLVINDIGPDVEGGSQRITQMVGSRPEEFATLDDAMAYRRQMSPIVRRTERRRPAGTGARRAPATTGWPVGLEDGRGLHPAARQRAARRHARRCGPCWSACPARPWWCGGRERCALGDPGQANGRCSAARGAGGRARGGSAQLVEPVVLVVLERFLAAVKEGHL